MNMRTVDWTAPRNAETGVAAAEGLRERKKRLMRQQLSDTATAMFLERGLSAVRVAEIAWRAASRRRRSSTTSPPKSR
jgi:hypothetical protein